MVLKTNKMLSSNDLDKIWGQRLHKRKQKKRATFIEKVRMIESYDSIDDVPTDFLKQFRKDYFDSIPYFRQEDPVEPPFYTNNFKIYCCYKDLVSGGLGIREAAKHNNISYSTFVRYVKHRTLITYHDLVNDIVITGKTTEEVIKKGRNKGIEVPSNITAYYYTGGNISGRRNNNHASVNVAHYVQKVEYVGNDMRILDL